MKETQPHQKDQIEIIKQQTLKKLQLSSRILPGDGHRTFEFSLQSHELREVQPVKNVVLTKEGPVQENRIDMKDGFLYITALNEKNAVKSIIKLGFPFVKAIK